MLLAFLAFAATVGKIVLAKGRTGAARAEPRRGAEFLDPGDGVGGAGRAPAGQDASDLVEAGQGRRIRRLGSASARTLACMT